MEFFLLSAACQRRMLVSMAVACLAVCSGTAYGQVRTKKPDRGVYRPPTLQPKAQTNEAPLEELLRAENDLGLREAPKPSQQSGRAVTGRAVTGRTGAGRAVNAPPAKWGAPLIDTELTNARNTNKTSPVLQPSGAAAPLKRLRNQGRVVSASRLAPPHRPQRTREIAVTGGEIWTEDTGVSYGPVIHDAIIEGGSDQYVAYDDGCDSGCDSIGRCARLRGPGVTTRF